MHRALHKKRIYTDQEMQLQAEPFNRFDATYCAFTKLLNLLQKFKIYRLTRYLRYINREIEAYEKMELRKKYVSKNNFAQTLGFRNTLCIYFYNVLTVYIFLY